MGVKSFFTSILASLSGNVKSLSCVGNDTHGIVILVMGTIGVGKSTFINMAAKEERTKVSAGQDPCTTEVQTVSIDVSPELLLRFPWLRSRSLYLVDTPGFDSPYESDQEIMDKIMKWLKGPYASKMVLGGVIYLHDISDDRYTGAAKKQISMFNALSGVNSLDGVVLGATKAGKVDGVTATRRLEVLKDPHWKSMINKGAQVFSVDRPSSALDIVREILDRCISWFIWSHLRSPTAAIASRRRPFLGTASNTRRRLTTTCTVTTCSLALLVFLFLSRFPLEAVVQCSCDISATHRHLTNSFNTHADTATSIFQALAPPDTEHVPPSVPQPYKSDPFTLPISRSSNGISTLASPLESTAIHVGSPAYSRSRSTISQPH
ncbi:hypothetical protein CVT25_011554 [Psilocybe cyanescens]|uniref:G domain-containing protein n=1 Tax=Psilocybe cyanescens TaxID=93625 RepID=A0A409VVE1_PSICY|nr:hypothetical protein CVT25_011554 [Psilocybe cyanescens]